MSTSCHHLIMYLSPAGTTAKVAQTIQDHLQAHGQSVTIWNLARKRDQLPAEIADLVTSSLCIWLGSPVYVHHALPSVLEAVALLPARFRRFGAGFAVYGAVSSGLALADMEAAFQQHQIVPLGMIKVVGTHSQFRHSPEPLGKGRPTADDLQEVHLFVDGMLAKLQAEVPPPLVLSAHSYQTAKQIAFSTGHDLNFLRRTFKLPAAEQALCVKCGMCASICPVAAISLAPWPQRNDTCIHCQNCIQYCPKQAYPFDHTRPEALIRGLAATSDEEHRTRSFL